MKEEGGEGRRKSLRRRTLNENQETKKENSKNKEEENKLCAEVSVVRLHRTA